MAILSKTSLISLLYLCIGYAHGTYADIIDTIPEYTELPGTGNIDGFEDTG